MAAKKSTSEQFMVRFPEGMRDRIKAAAEKNGRSMNSEIVYTLDEAYPDIDEVDHDQYMAVMRAMRDALYSMDMPERQQDLIWELVRDSLVLSAGLKHDS